MTAYTRLGANIWHWEPWTILEPGQRLLWLALYTSAEAKRVVPGLFHGSITAMADITRRPIDEEMKNLDHLLDIGMVEYDLKNRVLRLTKLPDAGEYPTSPAILESWWSKFSLVPPCAVRDAHVTTLRWILDHGASQAKKNLSKKPTALHEEIWASTFGTIAIPAPSRRGLRRLLDADTGTDVQPGLFQAPKDPLALSKDPLATQHEPPSLPPSSFSNDSNKIREFETLSRGSGDKEGVREGDGVSSFLSSSGSGSQSPSSGAGGPDVEHRSTRPRLTLVPAPPDPVPAPYTATDMLRALSGGDLALVREGFQTALGNVVADLAGRGMGLADIALAGTRAKAQVGWSGSIGGDPRERLSVWAATPGALLSAITEAQEHERAAAERSAMAADALKALGISKT